MARPLVFLVLALAVLAPPAHAHVGPGATEVVFDGAIPCTVVCHDWGWQPCEQPFPPGSYIDHVTAPAPAPRPGRIMTLEASLDPKVDWDGYLCANTPARTELAAGANTLGEPCDNALGPSSPVPVGCHEDMLTPVVGGQRVIFRAYSWVDPLPAIGHYWFTEV